MADDAAKPLQEDEDSTGGGLPPEKVEDRPSVGATVPDAYPPDQRAGKTPE